MPLHSGQAQTPWEITECLHVGCRQRKQGMPADFPEFPVLVALLLLIVASISSNGGLLKQNGQRGYDLPSGPAIEKINSSKLSNGHVSSLYS